MSHAIITVVGRDRSGIIAAVSQSLATHKVNILNISQTILEDYFTMMMSVDLAGCTVDRPALVDFLNKEGEKIGVQVNLIHEEVLRAMHRI